MIYKIRLENLLRLIEKEGSQRAFADRIGRSEAQVSQYVTGDTRLGDKFCRHVEQVYGIPLHSLDIPDGMDAPPTLNEQALRGIIEGVEIVLEREKITLSGARKTDLIMALYTLVTGGTELTPDLVRRMLRLMKVS